MYIFASRSVFNLKRRAAVRRFKKRCFCGDSFSICPAGGTTTSRTSLDTSCISVPICRHGHKVDYRLRSSAVLTCRPMMLRPSLSFSGAKRRCCFSAYFTPTSYLEWKPLDLALEREMAETERKMVVIRVYFSYPYCFYYWSYYCCHIVVLIHGTQSTHVDTLDLLVLYCNIYTEYKYM